MQDPFQSKCETHSSITLAVLIALPTSWLINLHLHWFLALVSLTCVFAVLCSSDRYNSSGDCALQILFPVRPLASSMAVSVVLSGSVLVWSRACAKFMVRLEGKEFSQLVVQQLRVSR